MKICFIKNNIQMINKDTEVFTPGPKKCEFEPNLRFDYILLVAITERGKKFIDYSGRL